MRRGDVGRFPRQSHLNGCRAPRNELSQFPLANPLQALVDLSGINFTLNDVQNGCVTMAVGAVPIWSGGHHHVLRLQETSHDIQDRRLPHRSFLRNQSQIFQNIQSYFNSFVPRALRSMECSLSSGSVVEESGSMGRPIQLNRCSCNSGSGEWQLKPT